MSQQALREIPAVDKILDQFAGQFAGVSRSVLLRAVRLTVDNLRRRVLDELLGADAVAEYLHGGAFEAAVRSEVNRLQSARHRAVVNATGILLHTGLGRAPLSDRARQAASEVGRYALVEVDPATGQRGRRETFVRDLLCELTGAEEATVVNNNAAAVLLLLRGLARDHEVLVSRGELVEIGGGFRVPAVMAESGAKLVEVGTTNRTRIADYQQAVTENTALLLHVHSSNFKIVGFTEAPSLAELVELGQRASVLVGTDLGSGYLRRMPQLPFPEEPVVSEAVAAGVDVATFSGDKMLGGPQCGILVGKRAAILALRREPLFRALRPDKLTLAALEATLLQWRAAGDEVPTDLPFFCTARVDPETADATSQADPSTTAGLSKSGDHRFTGPGWQRLRSGIYLGLGRLDPQRGRLAGGTACPSSAHRSAACVQPVAGGAAVVGSENRGPCRGRGPSGLLAERGPSVVALWKETDP
jgi:L-seryl-tRNA(Ser) seleniumtransferase